jgi:hypothetical protein
VTSGPSRLRPLTDVSAYAAMRLVA